MREEHVKEDEKKAEVVKGTLQDAFDELMKVDVLVLDEKKELSEEKKELSEAIVEVEIEREREREMEKEREIKTLAERALEKERVRERESGNVTKVE